MGSKIFEIHEGHGPIVGVAAHAGHALRAELAALMRLSEAERRREEDPYTDEWATIGDHRVVVNRSRFEVDLNRARDEAVYRTPADAWGLNIWRHALPADVIDRSLAEYDRFYASYGEFLSRLDRQHPGFVVLNLHSYNHRRDGPSAPPADPNGNPEINVGTGTLDRSRWAPVVDRFIADLRGFDFGGRSLDVRENVRFRGRRLDQFVHETFPATGLSLAVEVKKFFMDEWTGQKDDATFRRVASALRSTIDGIRDELRRL